MAYSLRYWYNNKLTDGKVIRLEIYKKGSTAAAMEIGDVVQGLSLNIDGGEDNIDAPIVSTSLVMTFCDAYDHPEAEVKKCGNYAEFYTPDATLWKVVLLCKDKGASSFRTLWGGYVTPDSYEEDLTYRGSVTIVARDNIGHMADFPFDAEGDGYGTISFREVIEGAWAKIESPMSLVFHDEWMQTEGVSALDTRMNVSAFEDKSWHEAVEAALYAYGAVLRFIGDNEVKVSPLRYMPNYGGSVTHSEPVFMTGATRMLTPAVKRIEETASYELEAGAVIPKIEASDYTGETGTYRCKIDGIEIDGETFSTNEHDAPIWPISTLGFNDWYNGALATTLFFNVDAYDIGYFSDYRGLSDEIKRYMYIAANQVDARFVRVYKAMQSSDFVIKMQFGKPVRLNREYELEQSYGSFNLKEITYAITMEQNGVTTYYHGGDYWSATRKELRISFDATKENSVAEFPVAIGQNIGDALFCFEIVKIEYAQVGPSNETYGLYACIQSLSFDVPENISLLQTNRVNTNYNEENNVIITRDPAIAPAYNTTFLPSVIKNGIFYAEGLAYKPAKAWSFAGDTPQQMAVYNHLQLLAYYAKPNNVIEGSIVNGDVSRFAHIWQFEGKEHILVSGRYNFISGYIEGAILREFARYESLWGSTGGTQLPATETSSETNIEASASSSSSANTYENTTIVNIGTGGGGSGASYLGDLKDVDTTAVVGGSVLYFNGTQWVDKTLQMVLNELKQLGDWFYKTEDGKSIGTKFNLFSEKEISANGLNLGGGTSGGGGLIQNVLGKSAFGTVASEDNSTTFNAYAIDSLYKRIVELEGKDVEVDLSDYYTKQQTQNAITSALSPYIKATDADGKYAALASFNALQSSFDRLYSALNDDTSGVINTWNEVVDFVNEYSGSEDLSTILGKMNTDINARVKVSDFDTWKTDVFNPLSVTVTNLGKKVDTNTANINKLLGWFNVDADGNLFTTYNFYSTKEISANGISQGTGGGGSGLISSVLGVGSLGATLTNDNSVVFNAYATNEIYKATQGHASRIGVLESQVGQLTTQRTKVSVSDLLTTGTKIATITVDGVAHEVKGDFLPTSGGKMIVGKVIQWGDTKNMIYATTNAMHIASASNLFVNNNEVLHAGNYSQYALPLTGGIITRSDRYQLCLTNSEGGAAALWLNNDFNYNVGGALIQHERDTGAFISINMTTYIESGSTALAGIYIPKEGGIFVTNATLATKYPILHSGNVGDYAIKKEAYFPIDTALNVAGYGGTDGGWKKNGAAMVLGYTKDYRWAIQAYGTITGHEIVSRYCLEGTWSAWKTIAFTDSNVASATKLQTARTIWGQSFDGSGNVSGNIQGGKANFTIYGYNSTSASNVNILTHDNNKSLWLGYGMNAEGNATIIAGTGIEFRYGTSRGTAAFINSSGNVGIGTTTPQYKLDVSGVIAISGISQADTPALLFNNGGGEYFDKRGNMILSAKSGSWNIFDQNHLNVLLRVQRTGNVLIGTTDDNGAKLQVNGSVSLANSQYLSWIDKSGSAVGIITLNHVNNFLIGSKSVANTIIDGPNILFRYGASATIGLIINSSGNVTIGVSDLAGTDTKCKLFVDGNLIVGNNDRSNIYMQRNYFNRFIAEKEGGLFGWRVNGSEEDVMVLDTNGSLYLYKGLSVTGDTLFYNNVGIGTPSPAYELDVNGTLHATNAVTFDSALTIAGATTHNGIAYFGGTTYYINTSGNANFNAISGDSLSVTTLTVSGASSFASKTTHNGGIGTAWISVSGESTFTGKTTHNGGIGTTTVTATDIETEDFLATGDAQIYGSLRLQKGPNASGNYLYFGDGSFCYLHEEADDRLTIYAQKGLVTKAATGIAWDSITKENWIDDNSAHTRFVNNYNALAIIIDKDNGASYRRAAIQVGDTSNNVGTLYLNPKGGEVHVGSTLYVSTINAGSALYLQASTITNRAGWWSLDAEGNFYTLGNIAAEGEISANALNQGSDIRFKHQLGDITLDLDTIANAPMFRFTWTNRENSRVQIGTSAQYWKDSARELVSVDKDDFHRLDYATLGVLIGVTLGKTVKNHEDRIKELEREVVELKAENRRLRYEC